MLLTGRSPRVLLPAECQSLSQFTFTVQPEAIIQLEMARCFPSFLFYDEFNVSIFLPGLIGFMCESGKG